MKIKIVELGVLELVLAIEELLLAVVLVAEEKMPKY